MFTVGITALFFLSDLTKFFKSFKEKFGLAASWIKTFNGLNFFIYLSPSKDESDLSFPPLIIITFLGNFLLICFLLLTTRIIFLNNLDAMAFSIECSKRGLFL